MTTRTRKQLIARAILAAGCTTLPATALGQTCNLFTPPPQIDTPDDAFLDSNGDGIDGMACGPIFVSPNGRDSNLGTIDSPLGTINAAIQQAKQLSPTRAVYIATGVYEETIILEPGVHLYGGYDPNDWSRSDTKSLVVAPFPNTIGAWRTAGGATTIVDRVQIEGRDASSRSGEHSIGLAVWGPSTRVDLSNASLISREGGSGAHGADGAPQSDKKYCLHCSALLFGLL